jgi:signal transduction histidine kinase
VAKEGARGGQHSRRTWLALGLGGLASAVVQLVPNIHLGYHNVSGNVALEANAMLLFGLVAFLLYGRYCRTRDYWVAEATTAAVNERRRLARDLHDGVVQELGYMRSRALCQRGSQEEFALEIAACADRALGEVRRSIDALTETHDEDLAASLERAAMEVGQRFGVVVHLSLAIDVPYTPAQREALVRIMREAVSNAARHGAPEAVWVSLKNGELTVRDDGHGFETTVGRPGGFGLTSMREHAMSVGAVVEITSSIGEGTKVMATW